jgi:hypothetical protein
MVAYTVFDHGRVRRGGARQVLEEIRQQAAQGNEEIDRMSVDQYADALIEDAPYFLDDELLKVMLQQDYPTKFDQALQYLAQTPTSGVRILATSNGVAV